MVFNGVDVIITQGDLADRLLRVRLPRVKDADRLTDAQAATGWTEAHPHILGGLLDLAARVHLRLRTIKVSDMPRMADFARVLACVDEELGTDGLGRYRLLSKRTAAETLDAPFIAALIVRRYRAMDTTAKDILRDLTPADPGWRAPPGWPKGAQMVSAQLTRHAPALRSQGWTVDNDGAHSHQNVTLWTIEPPPGEEALWRPSPRAHTLASFADPRSPNVL